jgi:hypothetical protein
MSRFLILRLLDKGEKVIQLFVRGLTESYDIKFPPIKPVAGQSLRFTDSNGSSEWVDIQSLIDSSLEVIDQQIATNTSNITSINQSLASLSQSLTNTQLSVSSKENAGVAANLLTQHTQSYDHSSFATQTSLATLQSSLTTQINSLQTQINDLNTAVVNATRKSLAIQPDANVTADLLVVKTSAGVVALRVAYDGSISLAATNSNLGLRGATPQGKASITGSRGSNAALASLLSKLAAQGFFTDNTTT